MMRSTQPMQLISRQHLFVVFSSVALLSACKTHDRLIYSTRPVKNLRVPMNSLATPAPSPATAGMAAPMAPVETTIVPPTVAPMDSTTVAPPSPALPQ